MLTHHSPAEMGGYGPGREAAPIPGATLCSVPTPHRHRPEPVLVLPSPSGTARAAPAGFLLPSAGGRNAMFALDSPALLQRNRQKKKSKFPGQPCRGRMKIAQDRIPPL